MDGESFFEMMKGKKGASGRIFRHYCAKSLHSLRMKSQDGNVYKAYFREHLLDEEGLCGPKFEPCNCYANVKEYENPKIFNLNQDPAEEKALDENINK